MVCSLTKLEKMKVKVYTRYIWKGYCGPICQTTFQRWSGMHWDHIQDESKYKRAAIHLQHNSRLTSLSPFQMAPIPNCNAIVIPLKLKLKDWTIVRFLFNINIAFYTINCCSA